MFRIWCCQVDAPPLPADPAIIGDYLAELAARLSPGTVRQYAAAIAEAHRRAGLASPTAAPAVKRLLQQIRRTQQRRRPVAPSPPQLISMAGRCPTGLAGMRDRAVLLLLSAGLSRGAVIALDAEAIRPTGRGMELTLPPGPSGISARIIELARRNDRSCPVQALEHWLMVSATRWGPVFRKVDYWGSVEHHRLSPDGVRQILARRALTASLRNHS
jgi:hypothetical protein